MNFGSHNTRHFPFFFLTTTRLASQSGYLSSVMDPTLRSFFDFVVDCASALGSQLSSLLLDRFKSWVDVEFMARDIDIDPHHILRSARECIRSSMHTETTGLQVGLHFPSKTPAARDCQMIKVSPFSRVLSAADDFFFFLGVSSPKGFLRFNSAAKHTREIFRSPQMVSIPRGVGNLRYMRYVDGTAWN